MQRDFDLKRKNLILPNQSEFKYLHTKVPACSKHNGAFAEIERKLKIRKCSGDEIYLWAFKVHVGLMLLDCNLRADIKVQTSGPMMERKEIQHEIDHFRNLFKIWSSGNYSFTPSPPGSVFTFPTLTTQFDLVHSYPGRCLGVSLGDYFVGVFFYDHGHATRANFEAAWNPAQFAEFPPSLTTEQRTSLLEQQNFMKQRIWLCETAYWAYRLELPTTTLFTGDQFILPFFSTQPTIHPINDQEFSRFSQSFALEVVGGNGEYYNYRLLS